MIRWGGRRLAAFCVALAIATASAAADENIGGTYLLDGQAASGDAYQGSALISPNGTTFRLQWQRPAPFEQRGYAVRLDNVLGVAADDPSVDYGIVLYRVTGGHLEGIWRSDGGQATSTLGAENLDGPEGLEGSFEISPGLNPNGTHYAGRVEIKRAGAIYLVDWFTPQPRYIGTGVLMGNIFVVGYGESHRSGVAAYCLQSTEVMEGITGAAADTAIGAEVLRREGGKPVEDAVARLARIRSRGTADCGGPIVQQESAPGPVIVTSR